MYSINVFYFLKLTLREFDALLLYFSGTIGVTYVTNYAFEIYLTETKIF